MKKLLAILLTLVLCLSFTACSGDPESAVASFVSSNKSDILSELEGDGVTVDVKAVGTGIVIDYKAAMYDGFTEAQREAVRGNSSALSSIFDRMLTQLQSKCDELTYITCNYCDSQGNLVVSVTSPAGASNNTEPGTNSEPNPGTPTLPPTSSSDECNHDFEYGVCSKCDEVSEGAEAVADYVDENEDAMVDGFSSSFAASAGRSCEVTVKAVGTGMVIDVNIEGLDDISASDKAQVQANYDGMASDFETMLSDAKKDLAELEYITFNINEEDGDPIAVINAGK